MKLFLAHALILVVFCISPLLELRAEPVSEVHWTSDRYEAISVSLEGEDELLDRCINSGFTLHYRFSFQLCRNSTLWFDECHSERQIRHSIKVDPISESYSVESDRYRDELEPQTLIFEDRENALDSFLNVEKVELDFLKTDSDIDTAPGKNSYVGVRVISHCEGEVNRTLSRISSFLTLGLVRVSGFNTGWRDFVLIQAPPATQESRISK